MSLAPHATGPAGAKDTPKQPGPTPVRPSGSHEGPCGCGSHGCGDVPELARLRYFHGQPLSARDLQGEQAYHRNHARLHNRLLHGWGVICGLDVAVPEPRPTVECDGTPRESEVVVMPGAALDCWGNEIVVRHPRPVRLETLLGERDRERLMKEPRTVYLSICFHETPIDPTRPLLAGRCEPAPDCQHARVLDSYRLIVSLERPDRGPVCEPCCGACGNDCLELAAIDDFAPGRPLRADQVDSSARRSLALRELTEIVAVNWVHGATYTWKDANSLLDGGLELWFSRGVQVATLVPGVIDLVGIEGGGGSSARMYHVQGEFVDLPGAEHTTHVRYRRNTKERLQSGDRVLITVRGDFILDECCRALDADHLGGAVPFRGDEERHPVGGTDSTRCPPRPSGDGVEGGEFVSWIYVGDDEGGEQR